jgi:hypothetical protein
MERPQRTISEERIAWAIGVSSGKRESDLIIARRLNRGRKIVRVCLDEMVGQGAVRRLLVDGQVLFEMIPAAKRVAPSKAGAGTAAFAEADRDDDRARRYEAARAEALWIKRMGKRRYRDDPRSLAEAERNPEIYRGPPDYPYTLGGVCCEWG